MKLITLISGGIDSPVAAHLMLKKGCEMTAIHLKNSTDKRQLEKIKKILKTLEKLHNTKISLYSIDHAQTLEKITKKCDTKLTCILCRRFMYRIAEEIAKKEKADAILTGESLGQVASQTLDNLYAEHSSTRTRVLRPLIGFDKSEIINISKDIGTYETSILPDTSCPFTPKYPETHAKKKDIESAEKKLDIDTIIKKVTKKAKSIDIS